MLPRARPIFGSVSIWVKNGGAPRSDVGVLSQCYGIRQRVATNPLRFVPPSWSCDCGHDHAVFQVTLAHAHEANQRIVEQLNDQVDFLNRQLANREAELTEVSALRRGAPTTRQEQ